jgi:hypothetical protein
MKKFIIILLCLLLFGFSYSPIPKYNRYIGKNVIISTLQSIYQGKIETIMTMDICKQQDTFGNCINREYYHSIVLKLQNKKVLIPEEKIIKIEEIK